MWPWGLARAVRVNHDTEAFMNVAPIRSEAHYEVALERIATLIGKNDQRSRDELEVIQTLVEKWDREHNAMSLPTPVEAIRFRMQQGNLPDIDAELEKLAVDPWCAP